MPETTTNGTSPRHRRVAMFLCWVLFSPTLLVYVYQLWWYSPVVTNPGGCDAAPTWWQAHDATFMWAGAFGAAAAGTGLLLLADARTRRAERWWPWPVAAGGLFAVGWPLMAGLSAAAWCPMG